MTELSQANDPTDAISRDAVINLIRLRVGSYSNHPFDQQMANCYRDVYQFVTALPALPTERADRG